MNGSEKALKASNQSFEMCLSFMFHFGSRDYTSVWMDLSGAIIQRPLRVLSSTIKCCEEIVVFASISPVYLQHMVTGWARTLDWSPVHNKTLREWLGCELVIWTDVNWKWGKAVRAHVALLYSRPPCLDDNDPALCMLCRICENIHHFPLF